MVPGEREAEQLATDYQFPGTTGIQRACARATFAPRESKPEDGGES